MEAPETAPKVRGPAQLIPLTGAQLKVLDALDRYRLLTAAQGVRVGLGATPAAVLKLLRPMIGQRLIAHSRDALVSGVTRLPRMHYLTPKGARHLAAAVNAPIVGARRPFGVMSEVLHRRAIVDIHLALEHWAASSPYELTEFLPEFEPGFSGRKKATTLPPKGTFPSYPADALARLEGSDGFVRGLLIEFERGGERHALNRFRKKLPLLRELAGGRPRSGDDADRLEGHLERLTKPRFAR